MFDKEKLKDYFTDILGAIILLGVIIAWFINGMVFYWNLVWSGAVGLAILLLPDRMIVTFLKKLFDKLINKIK